MAVAYDFGQESYTGTTQGSVSEASFTWSHNPVGVPRGVLVFVITMLSDTQHVTSVTYDGVNVPAVSGGGVASGSAEAGRCDAFFLGSGVPTTDPANVVVNRTNDAVEMYAVSITVTADVDTEVYTAGIVTLAGVGTLAQQSVDDGSPGSNSVRFAGLFYGEAGVAAVGADSTLVHNFDTGAITGNVVRETTAGQGARNVGWTDADSDDRAAVHLAVREILKTAAITGTAQPSITEADVVTGGKTIIITLTGDTWIAAGAGSFDLQRDEIIAGIDSAQSEATGWDLVPKALQSLGGVVRTSDTVVTVTLDAFATYNITAPETITVTVPGTALTGTVAIIATPTFSVTAVGGVTVKTLAAMGVG